MSGTQLLLTAEERSLLVDLLSSTLKDVQIEEHRTRVLSYRELVTQEKDVIAGLLAKLGESAAQQASPAGSAV